MSELDTRIALLLGEEVGTLEHHPEFLLSDSGGEVCARCNTYLDFDIYGAAREGFKNEPCSLFPKPRSRISGRTARDTGGTAATGLELAPSDVAVCQGQR